jgi:hypothetical protein
MADIHSAPDDATLFVALGELPASFRKVFELRRREAGAVVMVATIRTLATLRSQASVAARPLDSAGSGYKNRMVQHETICGSAGRLTQ